MMFRIFDPALTMKQQLQRALIGAVLFIVAIFLIVLLGSGLGTISTSRSTIVSRLNQQTRNEVAKVSGAIADVLSQRLNTVAASVVQTLQSQAMAFMRDTPTPLKPVSSWPEFEFVPGCAGNQCPSDTATVSLATNTFNAFASLTSSSVYSMQNQAPGSVPVTGTAFTTTAQFQSNINSNPVPSFVNSKLALLDRVFPLVYTKGPSSGAMFFLYSAASMPDPSNSGYTLSMLRQYPGMKRQADDTTQGVYDPAQRSWFTGAPTTGVGLKVYKETFTKQLVINLATKAIIYPSVTGLSVTSNPVLPCPPTVMSYNGYTTEFNPYAPTTSICRNYGQFYTSSSLPSCCVSPCDTTSTNPYMSMPTARGTMGTTPYSSPSATTTFCRSSQPASPSNDVGQVTLVHAAVLALSEVASILSKIEIQANRFIVICNAKTQEVIVFNGTAGIFDDSLALFTKLDSYFPGNGDTSSWFKEESFSATFQGDEYFAAVNKTFNNLLTVFVFGRSSDIFSSYPIFDKRAQETSGKIAAIVCAGILASILLSSVFIAITVTSINNVLAILTNASAQIVKISTEVVRDYSGCIAICNLDGVPWYTYPPSEFKDLLFSFRNVIKRLAFFETAKKARETKTQKNPLHKLASLFVNTKEPARGNVGSRFKLNSSVVGQKGIKVRKTNSLESDVIGYINDFNVVYEIAATTSPLAKLAPSSCVHVQPTQTFVGGPNATDTSTPHAPNSDFDAHLFGWVSMSLDGDVAFIDLDAQEAAAQKPEALSKEDPEKLLKAPNSCVPKELVVEYVQANLSLDSSLSLPSTSSAALSAGKHVHGDQGQGQIRLNSVASVASPDSVAVNILEEHHDHRMTHAAQRVSPWSLSVRLHFLITFPVFLCLVGISVGMLAVLSTDSTNWFPETKNIMVQFTQSNIMTTAYLRALFVQSFYDQVAMSMSVTSQLDKDVLSEVSLDTNWESSVIARNPMWTQQVSYNPPSSPPANPSVYAYPFGPTSVTGGYFYQGKTSDADRAIANNLTVNRRASVLDYYHKGALNPGSRLQWIQFGFQDIPLSRRFPYNYASYDNPKDTNGDPVCLVETFPDGSKVSVDCLTCPSVTQATQPAYDARCRTWFGYGRDKATTTQAYFLSPRLGATTGTNVITGAIQVQYTPLNVVLNFNFNPDILVNAINKEQILSTGYVFIIDCGMFTSGDGVFIVHPSGSTCTDTQPPNSLNCAEINQAGYQNNPYSAAEWAAFLSSLTSGCATAKKSFAYTRSGAQYYASMATLTLPLQSYAVVAVVPYSAVVDGPESIATMIYRTVRGIIIGLSVFAGLALLLGVNRMKFLVGKINEPVMHLSDLCKRLQEDDLSVEVSEDASSVDMRNVLSAFSRMIISLRFGSDTYVLGNLAKAQSVFEEALALFKTIQNNRGIAIANNNLGTVKLKSGFFEPAQRHLNDAIEQSRMDLQLALAAAALSPDPLGNMHPDVKRAHKTLGDRLGNLALCLQKMQKIDEHKLVLQEALQHDEESGNTVGFIVKQVNLLESYLVEQNLQSAIACVGKIQNQVKEVDIFGQLAPHVQQGCLQRLQLCQALVASHVHQDYEALKLVVESLTSHACCDLSVTRRGIQLLADIYQRLQRPDLVEAIVNPVQAAVFTDGSSAVVKAAAPKDVLFVLDYSGSMAGSRIKASTENILLVFNKYINDDDRVMLAHFNTSSFTDIPLSKKRDVATKFVDAVGKLSSPNGGTAFYTAVYNATKELQKSSSKSYIIGLTDGDDNGSKHTPEQCAALLKQHCVSGMIVISVEGEGNATSFQTIASATKEGTVLTTSQGAEGISKAFSEVAKLISGDVVLEDF